MSESWVQVGAPVLVSSGPFQGIDGTVDRIDPSADAVVVRLDLLGRATPLTCPLSSVGEHLTPFGDQPALSPCPNADTRQRDLLAQCPGADATYRTDCWWSTTYALVQVSRSGSDRRLTVRSFNLTWPCREKLAWSVREVLLTAAEWANFRGLIESSRFWQLPYDDGRRVPRKGRRWRWWLEGHEEGRYHAVARAAAEPTSAISECCECLRALAEPDGTDWRGS